MSRSVLQYLLITSAKNEEAFIEFTIRCVLSQSVRPMRWIIVSDGSTDRTDEIVARYAEENDWIELLRMPERSTRDFGGKALCFNTAYMRAKHLSFDLVGNLDADLSFTEDYYEFLVEKFVEDPKLGIGGTPFSEEGQTYDYRFSSVDHVSGAAQLFRRECFEQIGGYVAVKGGGIDVIAVLTARMKGWRTRTFTEKTCEHHRTMGSGTERHKIAAGFALGKHDYRLGFHPVWQTLRAIYQMSKRPYVFGGSALFAGYFWAALQRDRRSVSRELLEFQRRDQMQRLRMFFRYNGCKAADSRKDD